MENVKLKCGICGKEISQENYMQHIKWCMEKQQIALAKQEEEKRIQKMNEDLNRVKSAKKYYEDSLEKFAAEYPMEYQMNFGKSKNGKVRAYFTDNNKESSNKHECTCGGNCTGDKKHEDEKKDNRAKISVFCNGKELSKEDVQKFTSKQLDDLLTVNSNDSFFDELNRIISTL